MRSARALILLVLSCSIGQAYAATSTVGIAADGATLATDYSVPGGAGPFPVILARTPYGKATQASEAAKWVSYGYAFVSQDIRGTGASTDTVTQMFEADGWGPKKDPEVTLNWIHAQSWCNGKVGTLGFSAPGATSMLASGASSLLTTQIIENAPASFYGHLAYQGGVNRAELSGDSWDRTHKWRDNPSYNAFWAHHDSTAITAQITTAGLHMSGWFDIFQKGAIDAFMTRQHNGGVGAAGRQHLMIGPTDHGGSTGQLVFPVKDPSPGRTSMRRSFDDYYMLATGSGLGFTVKYYTMGAVGEIGAPGNEWRIANDWPPYSVTARVYYLGTSNTICTAPPSATASSLTYTFDPLNAVPTTGGQNLTLPAGPMDQRPVSGRADVLKFATAPLAAPLEISGGVSVKLYVSSNAVDTDFTAKLVDIYSDGREMLFLDGIQRVKYRNSFTTPSLLPPGTVGEVTIDLWHTSLIFNTGHRIGVQISSSNYPRFEVNPNNGNDLPQYSGSAIVPASVTTAQNTMHLAGVYPSALHLPVSSSLDADGDGLDEQAEAANHTDPNSADTDGDGLSDGAEVNTYHTNPLVADSDGDGLNDSTEVNTHHTNPLAADTDGDGLSDGAEVNTYHTNPSLADTDGDGK